MGARELTASVIDWILSSKAFEPEVMACEVPYIDAQRRVDLLVLSRGESLAIEVKSNKDNLQKIDDQVADYQQCFDKVFVVAGARFQSPLLERLPKTVGIIIIDDEGALSLLRDATPRQRLSKKHLVSLLDKKSLQMLLDISATESKSMLIADMRRLAGRRNNLSALRNMVLHHLKEKYSDRYVQFLRERGEHTHGDDLLFLSRKNNPYLVNFF